MDSRLIALKLFLTELGVPSVIDTIDDRKRVQKAVYLGQLTGVDLGYRFGWYVLGPYSPELTRDYYALADALELGGDSLDDKVLHKSIVDRLKVVLPLINAPQGFPLEQERWLELIASYHYLRKIRHLSHEDAILQLQRQKGALAPYTSLAVDSLRSVGLLAD